MNYVHQLNNFIVRHGTCMFSANQVYRPKETRVVQQTYERLSSFSIFFFLFSISVSFTGIYTFHFKLHCMLSMYLVCGDVRCHSFFVLATLVVSHMPVLCLNMRLPNVVQTFFEKF